MKFLGTLLLLSGLFTAQNASAAAGSCRIANADNSTAQFTELLRESCESFTSLCQHAPNSQYCSAIRLPRKNVDAELQVALEQDFEGTLAYLNENLFPVRGQAYYKKLELLDQQSRSDALLHRVFVTQVAISATAEWTAQYGDTLKLNLDNLETARNNGVVGGVLGYMGLMSVNYIAKKRGFGFGAVVSNWSYLSMRTRMVAPAVAGNILVPVGGVTVGNQIGRKQFIRVPMSPVHAIKFNDTMDMDYASSDMEEQYNQKDFEIFKSIFGQFGGFSAGQVVYSSLAARAALAVTTAAEFGQTAVATSKIAKVGRFAKFTVVSAIVGYLVFEGIDKLFVDVRVVTSKMLFRNARTPAQAITALNRLYLAKLGKAHDGKRVIEVYKALKAFGSLPIRGNNLDKLNATRSNLLQFFDAKNFPEDSKAAFIQRYICRAKPMIQPTTFLQRWTTWSGWTASSDRNFTSEVIAHEMSLKIRDYLTGLRELKKSLDDLEGSSLRRLTNKYNLSTRYSQYNGIQTQALVTRRIAIDRAMNDAEATRTEIKGPPAILPDNHVISAVWSVIGLPNQGKGRVKQYLGRIIGIEQAARNADFSYLYQCR